MNLKTILIRPVPDQTQARIQKTGYRSYPLLTAGAHYNEPLVDISLYGIAGQSYYSRPNPASDSPVAGVAREVYVRQDIAEKLAAINFGLQQSPEIEKLFGRPVELYIEEGYRSRELQTKLYDKIFPELIRAQSPHLTETEVIQRRDQLSAKPTALGDSPPPHATGAAIDVTLRYIQADLGYQMGQEIEMGQTDADTSRLTEPDYYEAIEKPTAEQKLARRNRRIFYWTMRGALLGDDTGFRVNPTEWWHWSYGDQMWAQLSQSPEAFYSYATLNVKTEFTK